MTSQPAQSMAADLSISTSDPHAQAIAEAAISQHDCQQDPAELTALLTHLLRTVSPRLVLEIGGWAGGSAWAWHQLPSAPDVITVTLPDSPMAARRRQLPRWHRVIWGDSTDRATVRKVVLACNQRDPDMVFIDGCHHYNVALADWTNYGPLVTPGGLVVFHDINDFPNHPDLQVHRLWAELKAAYPTLELVAAPGQACGTGILWP